MLVILKRHLKKKQAPMGQGAGTCYPVSYLRCRAWASQQPWLKLVMLCLQGTGRWSAKWQQQKWHRRSKWMGESMSMYTWKEENKKGNRQQTRKTAKSELVDPSLCTGGCWSPSAGPSVIWCITLTPSRITIKKASLMYLWCATHTATTLCWKKALQWLL